MANQGVKIGGYRLGFWMAVGGVSLLSLFTLKTVAAKYPHPGLVKLSNYLTSSQGA
jgi:hypothetical protein